MQNMKMIKGDERLIGELMTNVFIPLCSNEEGVVTGLFLFSLDY